LTYAAVALALAAAAVITSYIPAMRATKADLAEALRAEYCLSLAFTYCSVPARSFLLAIASGWPTTQESCLHHAI